MIGKPNRFLKYRYISEELNNLGARFAAAPSFALLAWFLGARR